MKTTDLRTAAQQALEALEQSETTVRYEGFGLAHREAERKHQAAITALRAALAQQQAEPLNLLDRAVQRRLAAQWGYVPAQIESKPLEPDIAKIVSDNLGKLYVEDPAEPAQEPVGEILPNWSTEQERISGTCVYLNDLGKKLPVGTKLYSSPPKAEPAQEQAEPLAWLQPRTVDGYLRPDLGYETCSKDDYGAFPVYRAPPKAEPAQEPVAWLYEAGTDRTLHWHKPPLYGTPLYTTPPPPQRKPLTNDRVWLEYMQLWPFRPNEEPTLAKDILRFARAIERAHGIGWQP